MRPNSTNSGKADAPTAGACSETGRREGGGASSGSDSSGELTAENFNERTIEALREAVRSRGFEVRIGGELFSDAMGTPGQIEHGYDLGTYEGMIKHNLTTIVEALK